MQFVEIFKNAESTSNELSCFVNDIVENLCLENEGFESDVIRTTFTPILDIIKKETAESQLLILKSHWFLILQLFAKSVPLAKLIITHSNVDKNNGQAYANTLLGNLLAISCLPKMDNVQFPVFDKPFQQVYIAIKNLLFKSYI